MSFLWAFIHRQFLSEPPVPSTSYAGRTVIVTGASSGLGLEAARSIIERGASCVILACRNLEKAKKAADDIKSTTGCKDDTLQVWELDMSNYTSILSFADRVRSDLTRLDALLLNAGISTTKFHKTEDNEETITTNVVSTALLAFLLHPKLRSTAHQHNTNSHVTIVGSELYEVAKFKERGSLQGGSIFDALNNDKSANMFDRYNTSKLLVMFILNEISAAAPIERTGVVINVVAPGFCQSELARAYLHLFVARVAMRLLARKTEVGARTLVYGAGAGAETHGQYLPDCKITAIKGLAAGDDGKKLQEKFWSELKAKLELVKSGVTSLA